MADMVGEGRMLLAELDGYATEILRSIAQVRELAKRHALPDNDSCYKVLEGAERVLHLESDSASTAAARLVLHTLSETAEREALEQMKHAIASARHELLCVQSQVFRLDEMFSDPSPSGRGSG